MGQGIVNSKSGQDPHSTSSHHPRSDNTAGQDVCPSNYYRRAVMYDRGPRRVSGVINHHGLDSLRNRPTVAGARVALPSSTSARLTLIDFAPFPVADVIRDNDLTAISQER